MEITYDFYNTTDVTRPAEADGCQDFLNPRKGILILKGDDVPGEAPITTRRVRPQRRRPRACAAASAGGTSQRSRLAAFPVPGATIH